MDKRFETYKKRKKVKKVQLTMLIIITLSVIVLIFGYKYYNLSLENIELTKQTITNNCSSVRVPSIITSSIKEFINNEKYSFFVTFLIFLGGLYLIQIGISGALDIIELIAFGFISIRGIGRLPNKIKTYFKNKTERRKNV